eukprot:TRINITY_DN10324_c0_g1_i2.p1 TRINITY_DN10324_c0_g1~~TRINITY_DN10324_c0_g1_i2.p1  ORF type:complete len:246 (+),score=40.04 TRINITY_DN10324_c0_g1_i2:75-812(+)
MPRFSGRHLVASPVLAVAISWLLHAASRGFVTSRPLHGCPALRVSPSPPRARSTFAGPTRISFDGSPQLLCLASGREDLSEGTRQQGKPGKQAFDMNELLNLLRDRPWLNPARTYARQNFIELSARGAEVVAMGVFTVTSLEKVGMLVRTASGMTPLEDSIMIANSGHLTPFISGMLWPAAQMSAVILLGFAIAVWLLEELQREGLRAIDVDVDVQRRRRITTVALFAVCVVLMISPPLPGVTEM